MVIRSDEPIESAKDDVLKREQFAKAIAAALKDIDASHGAVVGIMGPWGSGKTSLINLIRHELSGPPWVSTLTFNPWFFSGSGELMTRFFIELAAQLKTSDAKLAKLSETFADYGAVISPLAATLQYLPVANLHIGSAAAVAAGSVVAGAAKAASAFAKKQRRGIDQQRDQLLSALSEIDGKIVVFVDDIDRLRTDEIRELFKLVRLTASFPHIIYVLAFDRARVEAALGEDNLPGRAYLEKIVQFGYDLPQIPEGVLHDEILRAIDESVSAVSENEPFDNTRWPDIFFEIVRPLIKNVRDIRRYAASMRPTIMSLEGKVELSDVLALEAIRVCLPDVFAAIGTPAARAALTTPDSSTSMQPQADARLKQAIDKIVASDPEHVDITQRFIVRLFPDAARHLERAYGTPMTRDEYWKRKWVADPELLNFYLERVQGEKQSALYRAEEMVAITANQKALEDFIVKLNVEQRREMIDGLSGYVPRVL